MNATLEIASIVKLAETYAATRGYSVKTVSRYAANSGSLITKVARGEQGLTLRRRDAILRWFSENWPDGDVAWPADIERPEPETEDAA